LPSPVGPQRTSSQYGRQRSSTVNGGHARPKAGRGANATRNDRSGPQDPLEARRLPVRASFGWKTKEQGAAERATNHPIPETATAGSAGRSAVDRSSPCVVWAGGAAAEVLYPRRSRKNRPDPRDPVHPKEIRQTGARAGGFSAARASFDARFLRGGEGEGRSRGSVTPRAAPSSREEGKEMFDDKIRALRRVGRDDRLRRRPGRAARAGRRRRDAATTEAADERLQSASNPQVRLGLSGTGAKCTEFRIDMKGRAKPGNGRRREWNRGLRCTCRDPATVRCSGSSGV